MYSISFTLSLPFSIFLESTKNGSWPFFLETFLLVLFLFFHIFIFFFFYLTQCLWFDLHRHLFLLVLFLLCACDYNQEMEIQKSTCCHSKYVLFHLLTTFLITSHPPRLCSVIYPFSLHGFSGRAVLLTELTYLPGFVTVLILTSLNSFDSLSLCVVAVISERFHFLVIWLDLLFSVSAKWPW